MEAKIWYTSKTLWFNIITLILAALSASQFQDLIPKTWLPYITFAIIIGNLVLRTFFVTGPITTSERSAAAYNRS